MLHLCEILLSPQNAYTSTSTFHMTPFKNYSSNPSWKNRIRKGSLYVAVAAMLGTQMSCGNDNGSDWEEVTVVEPTKGVVTTLEETESGQFAIVDEQTVANKDSSRVIIKRLDGSVENLSLAQARGLVQPQDTTLHNTGVNQRHGGGMGHVLWWGAMGYMMGRNFGSPVQSNVYRNGVANMGTVDALRSTAVSRTVMRPVSGRSGFFRGSGRSSGAG